MFFLTHFSYLFHNFNKWGCVPFYEGYSCLILNMHRTNKYILKFLKEWECVFVHKKTLKAFFHFKPATLMKYLNSFNITCVKDGFYNVVFLFNLFSTVGISLKKSSPSSTWKGMTREVRN